MVGSLTVGKKKYADVEEEMWELKKKADELQKDLLHLIERDAEVFEPLSKAYGMPKRNRRGKSRKSKSYGNRAERCLLCSDGNHGKML